MSVLQMFVTPDELANILRCFAEKHKLLVCASTWSDKNKYRHYAPAQLRGDVIQDKNVTKLLLFPEKYSPPSLDRDAISPRQMGWIQVNIGRYREDADPRILELITIQTEDKKDLPFRPSTWLRALKKELFDALLKTPIRLTNIVSGDTGLEDDVGYSEGAEKLFREGVKWKQNSVKNQEWSPAVATTLNGHQQGPHG